MIKPSALLPVCLTIVSTLAFTSGQGWAADGATNAASQPAPADAPPAATVPAEPTQATPPATPATPPSTESSTDRPGEYTVASGDTLWSISHKFNTSIRQLKKVNHLKKNNLKPGQVLKLPAAKESAPSKKTTTLSHTARMVTSNSRHHATPLHGMAKLDGRIGLPDASVPSGPMPISLDSLVASAPVAEPTEAPTTVSDAMRRATALAAQPEGATPDLTAKAPQLAQSQSTKGSTARPMASIPTPDLNAPAMSYSMPAARPPDHGLFNFFYTPPPSVDWSQRFTQVARTLGDRGLEYADDWRPPGEQHSWTMDCSNTARYIYRVTTGIQLPRTASDQYYYLHLQHKAWDVPSTKSSFETAYLRHNLKAGDLLFWENTYKPERQPPITHVMVYLGANAKGQLMMAGSQSTGGGEHKRRHGGPDIYVFNPTRPCGGYSTWLGLVHHQGRFCAYGRPLEADKAKLAMAAND